MRAVQQEVLKQIFCILKQFGYSYSVYLLITVINQLALGDNAP